MLAYSTFRNSHYYQQVRGLNLLSQFDMTICHVPGKSNVVADVLLRCPDLAVVVGSVESGLLTQIREA